MKLKIYADTDNINILQTAWDTLLAPLVKKKQVSLFTDFVIY